MAYEGSPPHILQPGSVNVVIPPSYRVGASVCRAGGTVVAAVVRAVAAATPFLPYLVWSAPAACPACWSSPAGPGRRGPGPGPPCRGSLWSDTGYMYSTPVTTLGKMCDSTKNIPVVTNELPKTVVTRLPDWRSWPRCCWTARQSPRSPSSCPAQRRNSSCASRAAANSPSALWYSHSCLVNTILIY